MKPTKEQLADPKWWDDNANGYDYVFYLERNDEYIFADDNGEGSNFRLIAGAAGWKLLGKRPEQWRPEVGEMCEVWVENAEYWAKITVLAVDKDTIVWRNGTDRKSYIGTRISDARPIKTQREEFIEKALDVYHCGKYSLDMAEALYDSGLFVLTEKDGE